MEMWGKIGTLTKKHHAAAIGAEKRAAAETRCGEGKPPKENGRKTETVWAWLGGYFSPSTALNQVRKVGDIKSVREGVSRAFRAGSVQTKKRNVKTKGRKKTERTGEAWDYGLANPVTTCRSDRHHLQLRRRRRLARAVHRTGQKRGV